MDLEATLRKIGIRQLSTTIHGFKGCCAINDDHIDTSPSMHIHIEKGYVKCFSCGAFRTLFDFLTDNDVPFDGAIDFFFTDFDRERAEKEEPTGLQEYLLGRKVPKSFVDKGFLVSTLKHFNVGYDEVEKRITIPLKYKGTIYGVEYRQYIKGKKKVWSSDGFNKDRFIYNYEPTNRRVYVEGPSDTWRSYQNRITDVSATLNSNPGDGQLALMMKHKEVILAYDNDIAGYRGAFIVNEKIGREVNLRIAIYRATDPGECEAEEWQRAIAEAVDFVEFELKFIISYPEEYEKIIKRVRHENTTKNTNIAYVPRSSRAKSL